MDVLALHHPVHVGNLALSPQSLTLAIFAVSAGGGFFSLHYLFGLGTQIALVGLNFGQLAAHIITGTALVLIGVFDWFRYYLEFILRVLLDSLCASAYLLCVYLGGFLQSCWERAVKLCQSPAHLTDVGSDPSCVVAEPSTRTLKLQLYSRRRLKGAMAMVPAGSVCYLVQRGAEWDEVIAMRSFGANRELLCVTSTSDATNYSWTLIKLKRGAYRSPVATGNAAAPYRTAPPGIAAGIINWMCDPGDPATQLSHQDAILDAMYTESEEVARVLSMRDNSDVVFECGANVLCLPDLGRPGSPLPATLAGAGYAPVPVVGAVAPPLTHGAVVGATGAAEAHAAMAPGAPHTFTVEEMQRAIAEIQATMAVSDARSGRKSSKKDKDKGKKRSKSKRHRSKHSSWGSSRSRRRGRSSSSSSSGCLKRRESGKDRRVSPKELVKIQVGRFKTKADLLTFAASHPGALIASFLSSVYQRVSQGRVSRTKDLRNVSVVQWAGQYTGLQEVRDKQEVLTMAAAMDYINSRDIASAMDVLSQRIQAIQSAKAKNGTWEKASNMELVINPSESTAALPLRRLVA